MSFCPRCGAPTTPAMSFCTSCGESLSRAVYPQQPAPAVAPLAAPPIAGGAPPVLATAAPRADAPRGRREEPAILLLLTVITLGIYSLVYWWRVSKEVDAYAGKPGHAHKLVKLGVIVSLIAAAFLLFALIGVIAAAIGAGASGSEPDEAAVVGAVLGAVGTIVIAAMGVLAGFVVLLVGKYRVWETLEQEERRLGTPSPLSAAVMLVLTLAAFIVPFAGFVLPLVVLYMTADHLNKLWGHA